MQSIARMIIGMSAVSVYYFVAGYGFDLLAILLGCLVFVGGIGVNAWIRSGGPY